MTYVFDTSPLITLFEHYYPSRFPTLWENFNALIEAGEIISTRENSREIGTQTEALHEWAANNGSVFKTPNAEEARFITGIYNVEHFRHNIEQQKIQRGGLNADPFVIAKAAVNGLYVVTNEKFKPHAAKIPNICQHFSVSCINLEGFMEREGWSF